MSTNINISVGDNKLLAQASLQQNASRQAQLEKEANKRLEAQATDARTKELAAKGLDAQGKPLTGTPFQVPQLERRPAANRFGEESISMGWLVVGYNDWRTGDNFNPITAIEGTNLGRTLAISSTDATYWLQINGIPETAASGAFAPGNPTVYSAPFDTPYFTQRNWNNYTYDALPLGKGNYIVLLRFEVAYSRVRWNFVSPSPNTYAIDMSENSGISTHYLAFVVGKSSVRQLNSVPQQVKTYMNGRTVRAVPISIGNYYDPLVGYYGVRESRPPGALDFGVAPSFSSQLAANKAGNPNAYPYSGWYVDRMPIPSSPAFLNFASPAVYSKYTNYVDWIDFIPVDFGGGQSVQYGLDEYNAWFLGLADTVPESNIKNALGCDRVTNSSFLLNDFNLPIYKWQQTVPVGNQWIFGPPDNPPRPSITDPLYWKAFKTLSFSPAALPVPTLPSYPIDGGGIGVPGTNLLTVTDWGNPFYCRQQALALGFTSADLMP